MKRLILPLVLAAAVAGLGTASAAASTTVTFVPVDVSFTDTELCGFELNGHIEGTFHVTDFFDANGTLVKEISAGPTFFTITNPANGKTATTTSSFAQIITFNPDGSINTVTQSGLILNFHMRGVGTIAMDVGTVRFDAEGNILFVHGPHQFLEGDFAGFCNALADP
jgi:hypothetical protein